MNETYVSETADRIIRANIAPSERVGEKASRVINALAVEIARLERELAEAIAELNAARKLANVWKAAFAESSDAAYAEEHLATILDAAECFEVILKAGWNDQAHGINLAHRVNVYNALIDRYALRAALAKNPNPSGQSTTEASMGESPSLKVEASGPVGLGPTCVYRDGCRVGMTCQMKGHCCAREVEAKFLGTEAESNGNRTQPDYAAWLTRKVAEQGGLPEPSAGGSIVSCLCCGHVGQPMVWLVERPEIYVCSRCKGASDSLMGNRTQLDRAVDAAWGVLMFDRDPDSEDEDVIANRKNLREALAKALRERKPALRGDRCPHGRVVGEKCRACENVALTEQKVEPK